LAGYFQKLKCLQKSAWDSVISVVVELEANEWDFPTDCPGWTVKDCVSHLVGIEHRLLGREVVHPPAVDFSVAKNPQGRNNQVDVDSRKDKKISLLTDELVDVVRARGTALATGFDAGDQVDTPIGPGTVEQLLEMRILDCWVHEQDIRRAVGRRGNLNGDVAIHTYGQMSKIMPYVVGKKCGASDGDSVLFRINGEHSWEIPIIMESRRAHEVTSLSDPSVTIELDCEMFQCLCAGRVNSDLAIRSGDVDISGDTTLGTMVVSEMNYMI